MSSVDPTHDVDDTHEIDLRGVQKIEHVTVNYGSAVLAEYASLSEAEEKHESARNGTAIKRLRDGATLSTRRPFGWLREPEALPSEYAIAETRGAVEP